MQPTDIHAQNVVKKTVYKFFSSPYVVTQNEPEKQQSLDS